MMISSSSTFSSAVPKWNINAIAVYLKNDELYSWNSFIISDID